jgi:hypothetical protein
MNIIGILIAAIVPLIVGFIWYNPKVFGNAWMKAAELSPEKLKGTNMPLIFGLVFLFSFFAAFCLQFLVIHPYHFGAMLFNQPFTDPTTEIGMMYKKIMDQYALNYRTFKHGALHGTIGGITLALPIVAINALFEKRNFKYVAIHAGYWMLCFALMGGIVSAMV